MSYIHKNKKNQTYYLNNKGKLFWFSKKKGKYTIDSLPEDYKVLEAKSGLPFIKKI